MATIKNIKLKSVKHKVKNSEFFLEASIYMNDKRIGKAYLKNSDDKVIFDFKDLSSKTKFENISLEYKNEKYFNLDFDPKIILINDLIELLEIEKEFDKSIKKGNKYLAFLSFNDNNIRKEDYNIEDDDFLIELANFDNKIEKRLIKKYNPKKLIIFKDKNDFNIN